MSFGFSVGDFLAVGQLCWKVYKKCKDSPGDYTELSSEVGALHNVIKETEELLSQQDLTAEQKVKVVISRQGCEDVLKDLDRLLVKYENLGTNSRRTFDRIGFGMQDMNAIRLRLISNVTMLDAFNNTSSHARLENKLNLLIAEVRAGKREGSVISTQTFDTTARNDHETWEALRRELEDIGISPGIITEKRQFIIAWFQEAVAAGRLEEDAPSDDNDSAISLSESDGPAGASDDGSVPDRDLSSTMIAPTRTEQSTIRKSRPGQPADVSYSWSLQKKGKSRLELTFSLHKLRGRDNILLERDQQFLEAAMAGDESSIEDLLRKGVYIQARGLQDYEGDTALHLAIRFQHEKTALLLLSNGADIHARNGYHMTALHEAALFGIEQVIEPLLEKGADIDSKDSHKRTALICAAIEGHLSVVQLLLEKGADIECRNSYGETALIDAAARGHLSVVQLILEKGANIESKSLSGETALMQAAVMGYRSMVQLLLEKGAKVNVKDKFGKTALFHARTFERKTVAQLLRDSGARR